MSKLSKQTQTIINLFDKRMQGRKSRYPLLGAIDGHSAAGKSSLARAIQQARPGVLVVPTDDFYRPMSEVQRAQLDPRGGYNDYYDWSRLKTQVLEPLFRGQVSGYQQYDWEANRLGTWVEIEPVEIIMVEGCYAARPELRSYYEVCIWVETSAEQRAQRQAQRADATVEWLARWEAAEQYYIQHHRPQEYADFILWGE